MGGVSARRIEELFLEGWRPYVWLAAVVFLVYAVSLTFGFTHLDDNEFIVENVAFITDLSNAPQAFGRTIFSNVCIPYYRPLLALSFMIDAQVGGITPFVYHLTNVLLHAAVSCLVFLLFRQVGARPLTGGVYALFFAVHPALTQAVAWIPGRNDLLLALFVIPACVFFMRFCRTGGFRPYAVSLAFFGLALFTKESAIILAPLAALYVILSGPGRVPAKRDLAIACAGWAALIGIWFLMRSAALLFACDKSTLGGMLAAVWISLPALIQYVGKIFFPFNLSVYPTIADTGWLWGVAGVAVTLIIAAVCRPRDRRLALFGLAWFALFLISSFARPSADCVLDFQEHRMYVPLLGFMVMLYGLGFLKGLSPERSRAWLVCLAAAGVFAFLTVRHEMDFSDRWAFWSNASRTAPRSAFVHLRTGFIHYKNGEKEKAEEEYRRALALDPLLPAAHMKMGLLYMDRGEYAAAADEFRKEVALSPKFSAACLCLGVAEYKQGRDEEAVRLWRKALQLDPFNADAVKNLAIYYTQAGDHKRAICFLRRLEGMGFVIPPQAWQEAGVDGE